MDHKIVDRPRTVRDSTYPWDAIAATAESGRAVELTITCSRKSFLAMFSRAMRDRGMNSRRIQSEVNGATTFIVWAVKRVTPNGHGA